MEHFMFILAVNCPVDDTFVFTYLSNILRIFAIFVNCANHVQMFTHCCVLS